MTIVFIHDPAVVTEKKDKLTKIVSSKSVDFVELLSEGSIDLPPSAIVLAHYTYVTPSVEERMKVLYGKGALLIEYTGLGSQGITRSDMGYGSVYRIYWIHLEAILNSAPNRFEPTHLQRELDSLLIRLPQAKLVNALAALCWCASADIPGTEDKRRQSSWRGDVERWRGVFRGVPERDFKAACNVGQQDPWPEKIGEVGKLIAWFSNGPPADAPDFAKALEQMRVHLTLMV